jgi:hypothetical protein
MAAAPLLRHVVTQNSFRLEPWLGTPFTQSGGVIIDFNVKHSETASHCLLPIVPPVLYWQPPI